MLPLPVFCLRVRPVFTKQNNTSSADRARPSVLGKRRSSACFTKIAPVGVSHLVVQVTGSIAAFAVAHRLRRSRRSAPFPMPLSVSLTTMKSARLRLLFSSRAACHGLASNYLSVFPPSMVGSGLLTVGRIAVVYHDGFNVAASIAVDHLATYNFNTIRSQPLAYGGLKRFDVSLLETMLEPLSACWKLRSYQTRLQQ